MRRVDITKNSPKLKVEYKGWTIEEFEGKDCFAIKLGKVTSLKSWTPQDTAK